MMEKIFNLIKNIIIFGIIIYVVYFFILNVNEFIGIDINYNNYDINNQQMVDQNENIDTKQKEKRNYIDENFYPYYALLNEEEKEIYYDILEASNVYQEEVVIESIITPDELKKIFYSVLYDHPEIFWVKNSYEYLTFENDNKIFSINLKYIDTMENMEFMKEQFDNTVNSIVNDALNYGSDIEKEKYVHDTLANMIIYDENSKDDQSAYGALVNKRAVCTGYAKAFQIIMMKLNMPTFLIVGVADNESHAWNLILLNGDYYNVDVTWDDQVWGIIYDYYNLNDLEISKDHTRGELSINLVESYGIKY